MYQDVPCPARFSHAFPLLFVKLETLKVIQLLLLIFATTEGFTSSLWAYFLTALLLSTSSPLSKNGQEEWTIKSFPGFRTI